ncbi:O136 family O-antigen polymerase, partial [Escherichia coli]|nr:O136 family O-antigen polymerase [Escherichia coli]
MSSTQVFSLLLGFYLVSVNLLIIPLDYFNVERSILIIPYVFIFSLSLFFFALATIGDFYKSPKQIFYVQVCFVFVIIIPSCLSFIQNTLLEVVPSMMRYMSYLFTFVFVYYFSAKNWFTVKNLDVSIKFISIILFIFSILQIVKGEMIYMNGAYRLSSIYGTTPAGFALITLVFSVYFYSQLHVSDSGKLKKIFPFAFFMINVSMMALTQSRQSIMTLLLLICIFHFVRAKNIFKFFSLIFILLLIYVFYLLVVNTDFFPRLTQMLFNYSSDSSTHTRISIITQSYEHLDVNDLIYGIGLGGFNHFYYKISGEIGVAAHNDFFLFFVEGGVIALFFYCLFLCGGVSFWGRAIKQQGDSYFTPLLVFC